MVHDAEVTIVTDGKYIVSGSYDIDNMGCRDWAANSGSFG
jgi:hypothetical protein